MNITSVSTLIAVIGALVVIVNLLTEVIKKATWSKLPTNIVVVLLSEGLTLASGGTMMRAAQAAGCWVTGDYRPGDVAIYDFPGGADTDHTGIIESVTAFGVIAIEGNTGTGNDANGGQVQRRPRSNNVIRGAMRPAYDPEKSEEDEVIATYKKLEDVPEKFRPIIQGDGSDATGNGDTINLTHEQVGTLVFIYRGGFDRKLQAVGMETAVAR